MKFGAVYYHTQDLPNHMYPERGLVGKTLDLLKELLKEGYVVSTGENTHQLRRLKRYLPMIQRSQVGRGAVYYLDDKNKIALKSIIQHSKSKIFCYQELAEISNVFDVNISKKEKISLLGKKQSKTPYKTNVLKVILLPEMMISVVDFYIRRYCENKTYEVIFYLIVQIGIYRLVS